MDLDLSQVNPDLLVNQVAVLATIGPDGLPQQSAIWFIIEENEVRMSARQDRQKYRNLVADGRGTVLVFHPDTDNYFIEIRGTIAVSDDLDYEFADRLGPPKYGTDMRSFDSPKARRVMLALTPTKINITDVRGEVSA